MATVSVFLKDKRMAFLYLRFDNILEDVITVVSLGHFPIVVGWNLILV